MRWSGSIYETRPLPMAEIFARLTPLGYVPALELNNGEILTEGSAILFYLADLAPATRLVPPASEVARYRLLAWLNFIGSELHKNFSPLFGKDTPEEYKSQVIERLASRFAHVDGVWPIPLSGGRSFPQLPMPTCCGEQLG